MTFWVKWREESGKERVAGTCDVSTMDAAPNDAILEYYRGRRPSIAGSVVHVQECPAHDETKPFVSYHVSWVPERIEVMRATTRSVWFDAARPHLAAAGIRTPTITRPDGSTYRYEPTIMEAFWQKP